MYFPVKTTWFMEKIVSVKKKKRKKKQTEIERLVWYHPAKSSAGSTASQEMEVV